jgi:hypothetical protein
MLSFGYKGRPIIFSEIAASMLFVSALLAANSAVSVVYASNVETNNNNNSTNATRTTDIILHEDFSGEIVTTTKHENGTIEERCAHFNWTLTDNNDTVVLFEGEEILVVPKPRNIEEV